MKVESKTLTEYKEYCPVCGILHPDQSPFQIVTLVVLCPRISPYLAKTKANRFIPLVKMRSESKRITSTATIGNCSVRLWYFY